MTEQAKRETANAEQLGLALIEAGLTPEMIQQIIVERKTAQKAVAQICAAIKSNLEPCDFDVMHRCIW
jgi:predicted kinase